MPFNYTVKVGESIWDVVVNAAGNLSKTNNGDISNLDQVMSDNGIDDWTPDLVPGSLILISDDVVLDSNALVQLQTYPVCNTSTNDVDDQIAAIFDQLADNWILRNGVWDFNGTWQNSGLWKFNP